MDDDYIRYFRSFKYYMSNKVELVKQTVTYFCGLSGKTIDDYFEGLDRVTQGNIMEQEGADWLLHLELNTLASMGITVQDIKDNEVKIRAYVQGIVDMDSAVPQIWLREALGYIESTVPSEDCVLWSHNELGDLLKDEAKAHFTSAYNSDAVNKLSISAKGVFQFDLFSTELNDIFADDYIATLPDKIRDCIENDKVILLEMACLNEKPIRNDMARIMQTPNVLFNYEDFSDYSKILYYQYLYQVMCLTLEFELKNLYLGVFLPVDFYTTSFSKVFSRVFEFKTGFVNDSDKDFIFVIAKSRGTYLDEVPEEAYNIDKKVFTVDGKIETKQTVNLNAEVSDVLLSDWVKDTSGAYYVDVPKLIIPAEIKRSSGVIVTDKQLEGSLGTMAVSSLDELSITTLPYKAGSTSITENNFWRCVANFTFRRLYADNSTYANRVFYAPNTKVEGYEKWLRNALILFLFDTNNKTYSYRLDGYTIQNKMFFLPKERVAEICTDQRVLEDMTNTGVANNFVLTQLEESKAYLTPVAEKLYKFAILYIENSFNARKDVIEWDAGISQVQKDYWDEEKFGRYYKLFIDTLVDELRLDAKQFGFVKEF